MRAAKALVSLRMCTDSPEPWLLADAKSRTLSQPDYLISINNITTALAKRGKQITMLFISLQNLLKVSHLLISLQILLKVSHCLISLQNLLKALSSFISLQNPLKALSSFISLQNPLKVLSSFISL